MSNTETVNWGLRVKQLREERRLTQKELAFRSGVSPSLINKIERGNSVKTRNDTFRSLSIGFEMTEEAFRSLIFSNTPIVRKPESCIELVKRLADSLPTEINIYKFYPYEPGKETEIVTTIAISRKNIPKSAHGYLVTVDDLGPEIASGDYVIVNSVRPAEIGDHIIYLQDGQVHIGILKIVNGINVLENKHGIVNCNDALSRAVIIGNYRDYSKK